MKVSKKAEMSLQILAFCVFASLLARLPIIICDSELTIEVMGRELTAAINAVPKNFNFNFSSFMELEQIVDLEKNFTAYCFKDRAIANRNKHLTNLKMSTEDKEQLWILISQMRSPFYYREWENQTFVVLKKVYGTTNLYKVLQIYVWERNYGTYVYEWDTWKIPYIVPTECPCTAEQAFYRPCKNWEYCTLPQSGKQQYDKNVAERNLTYSTVCDTLSVKAKRSPTGDKTDYNSGSTTRAYYEEFIAEISKSNEKVMTRKKLSYRESIPTEPQFQKKLRVPPGCVYSFGPFFKDILDNDAAANLVGQIIAGERFQMPRFELLKSVDSMQMQTSSSLPFATFMNCPDEDSSNQYESYMKTFNASDSDSYPPEKAIEFYLSTLGAKCLDSTVRKDLLEIFEINLAVLTPGLLIRPNIAHRLIGQRLINNHQADLLEMVYFLSAYSNVYKLLLTNQRPGSGTSDIIKSLEKFNVSRNTKMITYVVLWMYDVMMKSLPFHIIKMTRRMLSGLKSNFIFFLQEKADLEFRCPQNAKEECSRYIEKNLKNRIHIMALMQFIVYGTNPHIDPVTDTYTRFFEFYEKHFEHLKLLVSKYDVEIIPSR